MGAKMPRAPDETGHHRAPGPPAPAGYPQSVAHPQPGGDTRMRL